MATSATERVLLLVGHGTLRDSRDVPEFLRRIRRGRPPPPELVDEIRRRYDYIGNSPFLRITESLARALETELRLSVRVAMRFWHPLIEDVVDEIVAAGVHEVCILPVAPFSVHIYVAAVSEALEGAPARTGRSSLPRLVSVPPYGQIAPLVTAHARHIRPFLAEARPDTTALILTAHSLPARVVAAGDPYERDFEASALAIQRALGWEGTIAYQSQGEGGGEWVGPTLRAVLEGARASGKRQAVVAPVGFLADHVETLFDLDVEAKAVADSLGLGFTRVPALNDSPDLVRAMADLAREAFGRNR